MISSYIKKVYQFLKKRRDFSFLNAAGILFLVAVVLVPLSLRYSLEVKLKSNDTFLSSNTYRDLTYIKPFTSLVGFNWKFNKENKKKSKETKGETFGFSLFHF